MTGQGFITLVKVVAFGGMIFSLGPARGVETHPNYMLRSWGTEHGLPQMTPLVITETRDGYLWVGTYNGLARFDGVRFKAFTVHNTPELQSDHIRALYESREGTLWIGTVEGGLVRSDAGKFAIVPGPEGSAGMTVRSICEDDQGTLWAGTSQGLQRLVGGRLELVTNDVSLSEREILAVIRGQGDDIWIGTKRDIGRFRQGAMAEPSIVSHRAVNLWAMDDSGQLWASFVDGNLGVIRPGTRTLKRAPGSAFEADAIHVGRGGAVWLGTLHGELLQVVPGNPNRFVPVAELGAAITAVYQDSDSNWWLGLEAGGLWRLRQKQVVTLGAKDGLPAGAVTSICVDRDGRIWVGSFLEGLYLWNGRRFERTDTPRVRNITSLLADRDGNLWFGAYGGKLRRRDESGIIEFDQPFGIHCRTLFQDREGAVWAGGVRTGLQRRFEGRIHEYTVKKGLSSSEVRAIAQDHEGNIWVGTSKGLNRIRDEKIERFFRGDGLAGDHVRALFVDSDGTLWIGFTGGGLTRWREGRFQSIGMEQGLIHDGIEQIIEDNHGYLWLGSNGGLMRVLLREVNDCVSGVISFVHCTAFREEEGLIRSRSGTGFQPSCVKTRDGKLWFGTDAGIVIVDPLETKPNSRVPLVQIEELRTDRGAVEFKSGELNVLPAGTQRIEFRYTGLDLSAPELVQFRYRLEGFESEWVNARTSREAVYTRVPPGEYRFQVLAANNQGLWTETAAVLGFMIEPFFWQTATFRAAAAVSSLGLTGLLVWGFVSAKHRREMRALEHRHALDRERARIAQDMHDGLGSSLVKISMLGELAEARLGEPQYAQAQIQKINAAARQVVRDMDEIVWAVNPKNDSLENFAGYLGQFAIEHFSDTSIQCHLDIPGELPSLPVRAEVRHNLFLAVREALNNILKHACARQAWIGLELADSQLIMRIEDDGRGFPVGPGTQRNGLRNMNDRMEQIGGRMDCKTGPDDGTCITFTVPIG